MQANEACAVYELLMANRWDILHGKIGIGLAKEENVRFSDKVLSTISAMAAQQIRGMCKSFGHFKMDHLACFFPGVLALGAMTGAAEDSESDLSLAAQLTEGCAHMWHDTPLGLAPEAAHFSVFDGDTP